MGILPVSRISPFTRYLVSRPAVRPAVRTLQLHAPHGLQPGSALHARSSPASPARPLNTVAQAKALSTLHCQRLAGFGQQR
jgi:hypothetical protein